MSDAGGLAHAVRPPRPNVYPERRVRREFWLNRLGAAFGGRLRLLAGRLRRPGPAAALIAGASAQEPALRRLDDAALLGAAREVEASLRSRAARSDRVKIRALAVLREIAARRLGTRPYDVQLIGARALLDGMLAEMETGEGKTLAAALAAATAALGGTPVHVVTANDYLAARDAINMAPLYEFLGLTVGLVTTEATADARRRAYRCDVAYCTGKELAFDYLRDRMTLGRRGGALRLKFAGWFRDRAAIERLRLRGLHFAIIDEIDSILIDEARTPLIVSGVVRHGLAESDLVQALTLARELAPGRDYNVLPDVRRVALTRAGVLRIGDLTEDLDGLWRWPVAREELVVQALTALNLFDRDVHYLVEADKVAIVDEYTGRLTPERSWSAGLHQMIELKEGLSPSTQHEAVARITYQRFFRRYLRLAGMTGTAREEAREFWSVYRLPIARIPTNRPSRRTVLRDRVCRDNGDKWRTIARRVAALNARGCPVLVGVRSVAASETASAHLSAAGVPHVVLNAAQDLGEAAIIGKAGESGRVTIATNMAGRGADIVLSPEAAAAGGLHVIMSERHDAARIDRQLAGRCGRQGDPGCVQAILSIDDELLRVRARGFDGRRVQSTPPLWLTRHALRSAQRASERLHRRMRRDLLRVDESLSDSLAFAGEQE